LFVRALIDQEARMNVRYRVELSQTERVELKALLSGGKHAARKLKRAQILLAADAGTSDEAIARSVGMGGSTVYRTKRRLVLGNLEAALSEEPRPGAGRKLSLLVATACSNPPQGRARWTLELLAGELVRLTEHDNISRETVRQRLVENELKPWRKDMWCIPQVDGEFVARIEDVLDLYAEQPDPKRPVVCFDESPTQLIGEARQPIKAEPGQLERYDCEYKRNGTANLFIFLDVHRPWRKVKVTNSRAAFKALVASSFTMSPMRIVLKIEHKGTLCARRYESGFPIGERPRPSTSRPWG
jgi:transposase